MKLKASALNTGATKVEALKICATFYGEGAVPPKEPTAFAEKGQSGLAKLLEQAKERRESQAQRAERTPSATAHVLFLPVGGGFVVRVWVQGAVREEDMGWQAAVRGEIP